MGNVRKAFEQGPVNLMLKNFTVIFCLQKQICIAVDFLPIIMPHGTIAIDHQKDVCKWTTMY